MSDIKLTVQSTPPTASTGLIYLDDGTNTGNGQPQLRYYDGANWHDLGEVTQFKKVTTHANASVTNTVTETSILGTAVTGETLQFGANALTQYMLIHIRARGIVTNTATPTLNIKVKLGSTEIVSSGAITTASLLSDTTFKVEADILVRTTGASGAVIGSGSLLIGSNLYQLQNSVDATTTVTIDTTTTQTLDITATWGTADPSNSITGQFSIVEVNLS